MKQMLRQLKQVKWEKLKLDLELSIILIVLLGIGISFIFSASFVMAGSSPYDNSMHFFHRQLFYVAVGVTAMVVVSKMRYQTLRAYIPALNFMTILLNLMLYVPFLAVTVNGATRWVGFGPLTFQPSELAKFTLILTMAHLIDKKRRRGELNKLKRGILPVVGYASFLIVFILMQKHLSAAGVLVFITMSMLMVGGIRRTYILALSGVVAAFGVIGVIIEPFRMLRIFSFLDPYADKMGDGFQIIQSWYALAGGGLSGVGLGMSRQKYEWLPENHTDFILAIIGEELGFVGILLVFLFFLWFVVKGLDIAYRAPDFFGTILATGVTAMFLFQFAVNVLVISGWFPVTGMPLPFISYGGTTTIIMLMTTGVLFNISSQIHEREEKQK